MKYNEIQNLAEVELKIDRFALGEEATRTPNILMKFLDIYRTEKIILHKMNRKYDELKKDKWEYYAGKSSDEVYLEKPFDIKVLRQDLDMYIDADPEFSELTYNIQTQKEKIFYLEKILRGIEQREFSIKNAITMLKHDCGEL
jgi:hypothetical protein